MNIEKIIQEMKTTLGYIEYCMNTNKQEEIQKANQYFHGLATATEIFTGRQFYWTTDENKCYLVEMINGKTKKIA